MTNANFISADSLFGGWRDDVLSGQSPVLYPVADDSSSLSKLEIGPGLVTLIGGPPGTGKTALVMQLVIDAVRLTPTLRVVVNNIEMPASVLLDRQLARLSGIDLGTIRSRNLGPAHGDRLSLGLNTLEGIADRLAFLKPPFNLGNVADTVDEFAAEVIVLDYIQRIAPPGEHGDKRGSVDACMNYIRQFADAGMAVIVVAAVSRTKDKAGRSSDDAAGLSLASFRESSELEFGADDAFILSRSSAQQVELRHLKARHSEPFDHVLNFDGSLQRFSPVLIPGQENEQGSGFDLQALWNQTDPADEVAVDS